MITEKISENIITEDEIKNMIISSLSKLDLKGKKVLAIVPDSTRTAPVWLFYKTVCEALGKAAQELGFLIALGTHPPMTEEQIDRLLKRDGRSCPVFNHRWDDPSQLKTIGKISSSEIEETTGGLFSEEITVDVNKLIFDYDHILIAAPTFPHEVVGFSGGNKYFFPGISGAEVLNFFHWLGAVITNPEINGTKYTPVRAVVDKAASMINIPKTCFSMVIKENGVRGLFVGTPEEAYDRAADLSSKLHIIYKDKPFKKILSMAPEMYDDIWTAGKCMYKLEPVVADGGDLIIYAPHVTEVSYSHGKVLDEIGYHVRDYFLKQMDKFKGVPRGVMAHSTHVKGTGTFEDGVEKPRVNVILATSIPEERCRKINLGYMDPAGINPDEWKNREEEGILAVPRAGEMLYKLKKS